MQPIRCRQAIAMVCQLETEERHENLCSSFFLTAKPSFDVQNTPWKEL